MVRQSRPPAFVQVPAFLLTRPGAQSQRFAEQLRAAFGPQVQTIISPLIAPEFPPAALPEGEFSAIILTSETAVVACQHLPARHRLPRRAWCVGEQTAKAARLAGFETTSARGDAAALIAAIVAAEERGPLLHLHGADTRGDVAENLNYAGIVTVQQVVYRQQPQPLTEAARLALMSPDVLAVPLFSPRTAQIFSAALRDIPVQARLVIAALSPAVAKEVELSVAAQIVTATEPTAAALIEALSGAFAAGTLP